MTEGSLRTDPRASDVASPTSAPAVSIERKLFPPGLQFTSDQRQRSRTGLTANRHRRMGRTVSGETHDAEKIDQDYSSSFDLCLYGAALRRRSEQHGVSLSVDSAQARVGRPLTPGSVAGVARRQNRRAAYGYGYGAGAAGAAALATAGVVAAATAPDYWGGQNTTWGNAYAAQTDPRFGQPHYAMRAHDEGSPYYGYSGWEDYSGRNFSSAGPGPSQNSMTAGCILASSRKRST